MKNKEIVCEVLGVERKLTPDEFAFIEDWLGEPIPVSNCCGAEIEEPIQDDTARCPECKEGCNVIYVWNS